MKMKLIEVDVDVDDVCDVDEVGVRDVGDAGDAEEVGHVGMQMKWKVESGRKTIGRSFRKKMVSTDGPTLPMKNNRQSTANSIRTCEASEEMAQHGAT